MKRKVPKDTIIYAYDESSSNLNSPKRGDCYESKNDILILYSVDSTLVYYFHNGINKHVELKNFRLLINSFPANFQFSCHPNWK